MEKFTFGQIKILICPNIVENGLDIQKANTIIIQNVQQFGLAQLYQERLAALDECCELGQGFLLAERDLGRRGFGTIFEEQQTGDVGNVGVDLFFEMLFLSLSKVDEHQVIPVPYQQVQNPMEVINEAENAADRDVWSLMQFTESLRHQYGKEPRSMEILLKKLYVRRMAVDLGISMIFSSGKMVGMKTNMSKQVFRLIVDLMSSDIHRNSLVYEGDQIKADLLLELPREQLLNWIFHCLAELHASLPALQTCNATKALASCSCTRGITVYRR